MVSHICELEKDVAMVQLVKKTRAYYTYYTNIYEVISTTTKQQALNRCQK